MVPGGMSGVMIFEPIDHLLERERGDKLTRGLRDELPNRRSCLGSLILYFLGTYINARFAVLL